MSRWATFVLGAALAPGVSAAMDVDAELAARGWFFAAKGRANGTDLSTLAFDSAKGQPELRGEVTLAGSHHLGASYLRIRREERGTATGTILDTVKLNDPIDLDIEVDDVRVRYGYDLIESDWFELEPFLELSYLREESTLTEELLGRTNHQDATIVFPLPGIQLSSSPKYPLRLRGSAEGMAIGRGHLMDVEAGAEASLRFVFAGVGYRYVDAQVENHGREVADVRLAGVFVEGGIRF